jgi:hypothetical protein
MVVGRSWRCGLGLIVLLAGAAVAAQSTEPLVLPLQTHERVASGQIAAAEGVSGEALERFSVPDLQITQPVLVVVLPAGDEDLELSLYSDDWQTPRRTTKSSGSPAYLQLRTQGELGIGVKSASSRPAPFELFVWVSDELDTLAMPSVVAPHERNEPSASSAPQGPGGTSPWMIVLVVIGVAIIALLSAVLLRMRRAVERDRHHAP